MILDRETHIIMLLVKIVGKFIYTENLEILSIDMHGTVGYEVLRGDMVLLVDLSGLVQGELLM